MVMLFVYGVGSCGDGDVVSVRTAVVAEAMVMFFVYGGGSCSDGDVVHVRRW